MGKTSKKQTEQTEDSMPTGAVLDRAFKEAKLLKADIAVKTGEMGALVKAVEEHDNIHRKAFKQALSIEAMDEIRRAEYLRHLFLYIDLRGLNDQQDMLVEQPKTPTAASKRKQKKALDDSEPSMSIVN